MDHGKHRGIGTAASGRRWMVRILDGFFLSVLVAYLFWGMARVPFFGDESTFIRLSKDFAYLFQDHDVGRVMYRPFAESESQEPYTDAYSEQYNRLLTGAINPLTIGLAWCVAGFERDDLNGFWLWWSPPDTDQWKFNASEGNMPSVELLRVARLPSTLFTAISIVLVFFIALSLSRSRPAAWVATFLYATNSSILDNGRMALQEGALLLFSLLVVLCAVDLIRQLREGRPCWRRILGGYGLLGLASGLALAGKENSALIIAPVFAVVFLFLWRAGTDLDRRERRAARLHLLSGLMGSGLLGISVFYFLMPVWWSTPGSGFALLGLSAVCFGFALPVADRRIGAVRMVLTVFLLVSTVLIPNGWSGVYDSIRIMAEARSSLIQSAEKPGVPMSTVASRIGYMADQVFFAGAEYWGFSPESDQQIREYTAGRWNGREGGAVWGILILILALGGLWVLLLRRRGWESAFLLVWLIGPALLLLLLNSLPWQRYYLVLIAPWYVLAGFAAVPLTSSSVTGLFRRLREHRPAPGPATGQ